MSFVNQPTNPYNLVNYNSIPTQASNEVYVASTDAPDSTASLIKNNVIIEISFASELREPIEFKQEDSK